MFRSLAAGTSLFVLHSVFAPLADADHAPLWYPDGTVVHGDWGLYRPGHMPLRYEFNAPPTYYIPYYGYATPRGPAYPVNGVNYPVYKDTPPVTLKGYEPQPEAEVKHFYPSGTGSYYPSNRNDPAAYTPRPNENGPTRRAQQYYREWGAQSLQVPEQNDPTIYPRYEMPSGPYVIPQDFQNYPAPPPENPK